MAFSAICHSIWQEEGKGKRKDTTYMYQLCCRTGASQIKIIIKMELSQAKHKCSFIILFFFFLQNSSVNAWYYCLIHGGAFVSHYNDLAVTLHNMDEASTSEK